MDNTNINLLIQNPRKYAETLKISTLADLLRYLTKKYTEGNSILSDEIFDILVDVLAERDPNNSFLLEVGSNSIDGSVKLPFPMASLDKIKSDNEKALDLWKHKYHGPYIVCDKLDGISVLLVSHMKKVKLYTRSNASTGVDISKIVNIIFSKEFISDLKKNNYTVRGELLISKKNFEKINKIYKNPRNAIKGIITKEKREHVKLLDFVAYDLLNTKNSSGSKSNQLEKLEFAGFNVVNYELIDDISNEILDNILIRRKEKSEYEIDGIVIIDNESVTEPTTENPKYSIAYKKMFDYQTAVTKVIDVIWNISMHGYIIPTIKIKPVEISGTTISFVTGNNAKFIVANKIGKNAEVLIVRSGDVIPKIVKVLKPAKEISEPIIEHKWDENEVHYITKSLNNNKITVKKLNHFFRELGVKFLNIATIEKFVSVGLNTPELIMLFSPSQVSSIEGLGVKIARKIRENMDEAISKADLTKYMAGSLMFGRGFGIERATLILDSIPDLFSKKYDEKELYEKLCDIHGIGEKIAVQIIKGYKKFELFYKFLINNKFVDELIDEKITGNYLEGEIIAMTGFRDSLLTERIKELGGIVRSSVSNKTTILICANNADQSTNKFIAAKKNNTKIMTKYEFEKYIKGK